MWIFNESMEKRLVKKLVGIRDNVGDSLLYKNISKPSVINDFYVLFSSFPVLSGDRAILQKLDGTQTIFMKTFISKSSCDGTASVHVPDGAHTGPLDYKSSSECHPMTV